ncbi:hypothetical protein V5F77_20570 [Xanthobacter sp. DSM 24535]|uniref:hypothetical protein n=1 Tax=Roseixanthobacter psychrophilus TaxID=3119917 RepID=UPI00372A7327
MAGGVEGVPPGYEGIATALSIIGAALIVAWRYAKAFMGSPPPTSSTEMQVVGGALADRGAMDRLAQSIDQQTEGIERVGDLLDRLIEQQDRHHAAKNLDTLHRRLDDMDDLKRALDDLRRRMPS